MNRHKRLPLIPLDKYRSINLHVSLHPEKLGVNGINVLVRDMLQDPGNKDNNILPQHT